MRQLQTIIFLLIFNTHSWGQVGIGVVAINFNDKTILDFYMSKSSSKPVKTIEFFSDESISSWNIRNIDSHKDWLNPESLSLDYSSFVFRLNQQSEGWYEVIVNNKTGE
ncbi:MAG: hypothetical protein ACK4ND_12905, partial [Cytophagaceae bacterium]